MESNCRVEKYCVGLIKVSILSGGVQKLQRLLEELSIPVIAAPLFIVSQPKLVISQCLKGVVGSMPALNARPQSLFDGYLKEISDALEHAKESEPERKVAPYAINLIIHSSNARLDDDLEVCKRYKVPIIITSLGNPAAVVREVHGWGGVVFHDVTTLKHAKKAIEAGVDGLILVCNGAGGHAGKLNPFAFLKEVRKFYDGPLVLSGCITHGSDILAAQIMGADFVYIGTKFIASDEANAGKEYKEMVVESSAEDIINTAFFTGIAGNYLRGSIINSGLTPDDLTVLKTDSTQANLGENRKKVWKDIWGAGQSVAGVDAIKPVSDIVDTLHREYIDALASVKTGYFDALN